MVDRKRTERITLGRYETAEMEFARKAMVEIVVLVRDLRFARVVRMLAFLLRELGDQMLE